MIPASLAQFAGTAAVDALWQGALIACGLALCLRLAPRMAAAHRFAAWAAAFGLMAGLPLLAAAAAGRTAGTAGVTEHGVAARPWLNLDMRWSVAIAAVQPQ